MVSIRTYIQSLCSSACDLIFPGAFVVTRYPDHDASQILWNRIGPTYYSFAHQTLHPIKIQDGMPRQVLENPQELFLTCDMSTLIASLPGFNSIMSQA